ncbi:MAG TPA: hypothetical protein VFE24_03745 [Pirellulales bacterium]|jgi:hypothetical protein|nr:hypothetical protein [Pirellulales bacterium]
MSTYLRYNGILLRNVQTLEFSQVPVRDSSGTDQVFHQYTLRIQSIVDPNVLDTAAALGAGIVDGETIVDTMKRIRCQLAEDRGDLDYYMFTDRPGYDAGHLDGAFRGSLLTGGLASDCNNGPKVIHCNIVHIARNLFRIEFGIQVSKICCDTTGDQGTPPAVLNNRWSMSDDMDDNFRTVRTWQGRLRVSTAVQDPQQFRGLVVPTLANGFKFRRGSFTVDPSGLELSYTLVHEEISGYAAPAPATKISGSHTEATDISGASCTGDLVVRLEGPKNADKLQLVERCMQIADAKLQIFSARKSLQIEHLAITDYLSDSSNAIEVRARVQHTPDVNYNGAGNIGAVILSRFGLPFDIPEYDGQWMIDLGPYGTSSALVSAFRVYLQTPCVTDLRQHQLGNSLSGSAVADTTRTGDERSGSSNSKINIDVGKVPVFPANRYSSEQGEAIYNFYQIESKYLIHQHKVALPIASSSKNDGDTVYFGTLGPKTAHRVVRIAAERIGAWPTIPTFADFEDGGIRYVLIDTVTFDPKAPHPTSDGKRQIYSVDAQLTYGMSRPPNDSENMRVGALPWTVQTPLDNQFEPDIDMWAPELII